VLRIYSKVVSFLTFFSAIIFTVRLVGIQMRPPVSSSEVQDIIPIIAIKSSVLVAALSLILSVLFWKFYNKKAIESGSYELKNWEPLFQKIMLSFGGFLLVFYFIIKYT